MIWVLSACSLTQKPFQILFDTLKEQLYLPSGFVKIDY